jgi:O-antigen/teichoic acid export membrane protein
MVTLMSVGVAVALGITSGPVVRILFGQAFADAVPALRWLLLGTVAWSTTNVTWPFVSAEGRPGGLDGPGLHGLLIFLNHRLNP